MDWFYSILERALFYPLAARRLAAMRAETKRLNRETAQAMREMRDSLILR